MAVNIQKSYAKLNEKIAKAFDGLGVRRSATIPYVEGHGMADHINAVSTVLDSHGGMENNFLSTYHFEGKRGYGSADGETVLHPVEKLRTTIIPKDDKDVKEAIDAAQSHLSNFRKVLGKDDGDVQTSQHQLDLVKRADAAGMTALDFGILLQQIMFRPSQKAAKQHVLSGAGRTPGDAEENLSAPSEAGGGQETAQGEAEAAPQGPEAGQAPVASQGAAAPQGGAPQAVGAAPVAAGGVPAAGQGA